MTRKSVEHLRMIYGNSGQQFRSYQVSSAVYTIISTSGDQTSNHSLIIRSKQLSSVPVYRAQVFGGFSGHGNSIHRSVFVFFFFCFFLVLNLWCMLFFTSSGMQFYFWFVSVNATRKDLAFGVVDSNWENRYYKVLLCVFDDLRVMNIGSLVSCLTHKQKMILFGLVCWVLWHINLCRLFNAKSIFM